MVFNIHGEDLLVTTPLAAKLLEIAKPMLYEAKFVVVPSYYFKEVTIKLLPRINEDKIIVSASGGIKDDFFITRESKEQITTTVGYVSRIDRGKGWDDLVRAAKVVSQKGLNCKFVIVGGGEQVPQLKEMIKELALDNIHYLGPVEYSKLPEIYSRFDVFVFPTRLEESLGLVGLEAMASGCPIISTMKGGITDYAEENYNGFSYKEGDAIDLARKIEAYMNSTLEEKHVLSENAVSTAEKYRSYVVSKELFSKLFANDNYERN